ncbi:PTS system transporter subunit IIA [Listeria aquatica FSL S10-1188]|uniref:PTS system transporter subunit IIA n=2 Tax=Listeria aquatica TaxID=1494960 RepID=W7BPC1_9LIST|nr:PTS sugar transporter subunit IIA [Listeria aquatica]EUJ21903.1 PTS system transporter subunit IIA [Listeria aquatica FSL S10-1188]
MSIMELLNENRIIFDETITTKNELFEKVAERLEAEGSILNGKKFVKDLYKREAETSTGIESGFGIPHAKSKQVTKPLIAFVHSGKMTDYFGLDESPVEWSFIIAVPKKAADTHLEILSELSRKLMDPVFQEELKNTKDYESVSEVLT